MEYGEHLLSLNGVVVGPGRQSLTEERDDTLVLIFEGKERAHTITGDRI